MFKSYTINGMNSSSSGFNAKKKFSKFGLTILISFFIVALVFTGIGFAQAKKVQNKQVMAQNNKFDIKKNQSKEVDDKSHLSNKNGAVSPANKSGENNDKDNKSQVDMSGNNIDKNDKDNTSGKDMTAKEDNTKKDDNNITDNNITDNNVAGSKGDDTKDQGGNKEDTDKGNKKWIIGEKGGEDTKVAYLTFDDGPSKNTSKILDILKANDVKATFFIIGNLAQTRPEMIKRQVAEGHAIGNHTYSHDYKKIYSSVNELTKDIQKSDKVLKDIIGSDYNLKLFRFPGGSFGKKLAPFRAAVENIGYEYVDWNALNGDAEGRNIPVAKLISNVKKTAGNKKSIVILMHDAGAKHTTVEALPAIIKYLKSQGYQFKTLAD